MSTLASARSAASACEQQLVDWLLGKAYPLWSGPGVDRGTGGFQERLSQDGSALVEPRRARVQPRQIFAFAKAPALGWRGDARGLVERGTGYFLRHYRRTDGLYRTLVAPDGAPLDNSVLLYDQAFALLGLASARELLGPDPAVDEAATDLFEALYSQLKRVGPGFYSGLPERFPLLSNPHMHLFEAVLAWCSISPDPGWQTLADELGTLALTHFLDPASGAVREEFNEDWSARADLRGRRVEPGHQFEWAWLLLRWRGQAGSVAHRTALRLIQIAEQHGVRQGAAVDALLDDLSVLEPTARLWPQTERLKAHALAGAMRGEAWHWSHAAAAAETLLRYLDTPTPGLWYDRLQPDGSFHVGPAPASSFYHIVTAIAVLRQALSP